MKLIRITNHKITSVKMFSGVCNVCNSPYFYDDKMFLVEISQDEKAWTVVPIDTFICPWCGETIKVMRIFKSLDVSKELVSHD